MTAMHDFDFVRDATRTHQESVAGEKINRAWDVQAVSGVQSSLSERRFAAAGAISRKTLYESVAGVCNAALASVIPILYEDIDGILTSVNPDTWQIDIPLPWARRGYAHYGLRSTERDVLRSLLQMRQSNTQHGHIHLVWFDTDLRRWVLNLADYPTVEYGQAYLDQWPIRSKVVAKIWRPMMARKRGAK